MKKPLDEIHPGEILLEEFMTPLGITAQKLAADIDVPPSYISELVNGTRPITADTALRLSVFFGMEQRFWLNLQAEYDTRIASRLVVMREFDADVSADGSTTPILKATKSDIQ